MTPHAIFSQTGLETPTPMQDSYWKIPTPYSILLANTGSCKTLAFCVKLEMELSKSENTHTALILCPTRELAAQVAKNYASIKTGRKTVLCYGGHSFKNEEFVISVNKR